jgi:hypothetical protein
MVYPADWRFAHGCVPHCIASRYFVIILAVVRALSVDKEQDIHPVVNKLLVDGRAASASERSAARKEPPGSVPDIVPVPIRSTGPAAVVVKEPVVLVGLRDETRVGLVSSLDLIYGSLCDVVVPRPEVDDSGPQPSRKGRAVDSRDSQSQLPLCT